MGTGYGKTVSLKPHLVFLLSFRKCMGINVCQDFAGGALFWAGQEDRMQ